MGHGKKAIQKAIRKKHNKKLAKTPTLHRPTSSADVAAANRERPRHCRVPTTGRSSNP